MKRLPNNVQFEHKYIIADVDLIRVFGRSQASFISQILYWRDHQKCGVYWDGTRWIYNRFEEWAKQLMLSVRTIKRMVKKLVKDGILRVSKLALNRSNRVNHYAINDEMLRQKVNDMQNINTLDAPQNSSPRSEPSMIKPILQDCSLTTKGGQQEILDSEKGDFLKNEALDEARKTAGYRASKSREPQKSSSCQNVTMVIHRIQDIDYIYNNVAQKSSNMEEDMAMSVEVVMPESFIETMKEIGEDAKAYASLAQRRLAQLQEECDRHEVEMAMQQEKGSGSMGKLCEEAISYWNAVVAAKKESAYVVTARQFENGLFVRLKKYLCSYGLHSFKRLCDVIAEDKWMLSDSFSLNLTAILSESFLDKIHSGAIKLDLGPTYGQPTADRSLSSALKVHDQLEAVGYGSLEWCLRVYALCRMTPQEYNSWIQPVVFVADGSFVFDNRYIEHRLNSAYSVMWGDIVRVWKKVCSALST